LGRSEIVTAIQKSGKLTNTYLNTQIGIFALSAVVVLGGWGIYCAEKLVTVTKKKHHIRKSRKKRSGQITRS
jgi:IS4 transposase